MTARAQRRAWVSTRVLQRELAMTEAARMVGLSERQLWRLRSAFERDGPAGGWSTATGAGRQGGG